MRHSLLEPQLNDIERLLRDYNLLKEREKFPNFSQSKASLFKRLSYYDNWKKSYQERIFNFCLIDYSLITFEFQEIKKAKEQSISISYRFIDCPLNISSYEDFLGENELSIDDAGDTFRSDYELALSDSPVKDTFIPVRYDYDLNGYKQGVHPLSHLHFGYQNEVRIATEHILQPISFFLFIMRQYYPQCWKDFMTTEIAPAHCKKIRDSLDKVDKAYLQAKDLWEMILR